MVLPRFIRLLTALAVAASASWAEAADYYVAPSGNDAADGSIGTPFQTIQKALAVAQPGDAVKLRAGTYREAVSPVQSGAAGSPITIEAYNGEAAVVSAFDSVAGPWAAQGNGIYSTTVSGARPTPFWNSVSTSTNGTAMTEIGGSLVMNVVNEGGGQATSTRSSAPSAVWDFFNNAVTWQVRGLSAASTGTTPLPLTNTNLYFTIMNAASIGFSTEDAVNVYYRGDGRLALNLKKNTVNTWGTSVQTVTDPTITGFDLTLGPASGANVPYTFTVKKASGPDVVLTGNWAITQAEWTDGGTGTTSYLGMFAQESQNASVDVTQKFTMTVGSYKVTTGATTVLRDEFDDGEVTSVNETTAVAPSSLSSGYDQVFVDGAMQHEARLPNHGAGNLLQPVFASVTVVNGSAASNPNTITSASFPSMPANYYAGARFVGGVASRWSQQTAVIASSSGGVLTVDPATKSTWWWPDQFGTGTTSSTGNGFLYGLLSFLDADGEWFLDQPSRTLSLRIAGQADPTGHLVEIKQRNWCVNVNGFNYITLRGLRTIGGAIRLNGTGIIFENSEASHLSHFLTWTSGGGTNGGRTEGGGVVVSGTGNIVRGCNIHDTAGGGLTVSGSGHFFTRNVLTNIDYSGTYAAPLALSGTECVATFNTIQNTGRDGIRPTGTGHTVMFNDVSNVGRLARDCGAVYTFGTDGATAAGKRTRIAYNWLHDRADTGDSLSKGFYLDNGTRNYTMDHNVIWNVASGATSGACFLNSPAFGHELYHNTIVGAGSYNENTFTTYPTSTTFGGYVFNDTTHGLAFIGWNNMEVPDASSSAAFESFATQDFRPKTTYTFTDERIASPISAVNPTAVAGLAEWIKPTGTSVTNPYIALSMTNPSAPFFYRENYGHAQAIAGINAWVPDGRPDSGAYERGVARWVPGSNGWEGMKIDPALGIGARTAILQATRIAVDATATNVRVYFGPTDGGTTPGAWAGSVDLGTAAPDDVVSVFRTSISGLAPNSVHYARFIASNASGDSWSDALSFTTAASLTWDAGGGASTGLSVNTNWQNDATPDLAAGGEVATFGAAGSTAVIDRTVSLLGLVFNRDANFTIADGAGSLTLGSDGITFTLPTTTGRTHTISESQLTLAADQTWSITNNTGAATLNVSSVIGDGAGAFGFTKTGSGVLSLSGDNTFDGEVAVDAGILAIAHGNALGSTAGATTIASTGSTATGGQVRLSGDITSPENFILTGTTEAGSFPRAIENTSGTNTLTGTITLVGNLQVRLGPLAGTLNLNGAITRSSSDNGAFMLAPNTGAIVVVNQPIDLNGGALNISAPGTVVLAASSTDLGTTTIFFGSPAANGTVLRLATHNALPTNRTLTLGTTGTSNGADRGTFDLAGFNQTINGLIGSVGTGTTPSAASTRRIINSAAATTSVLTVGNGNGTATFNGLIEDGAGKVALVKVGTGTQTIAAASTYTGETTVSAGTLSLTSASLADAANVNLATGAILNLNFAGTDTIAALRINGLAVAAGTWGGLASSATNKTALITGTGLLLVSATPPPYDTWALAAGLDNTGVKDASLGADPDRDGFTNLFEYATRQNPLAGDQPAQTTVLNGANLEFTYTRNSAATDVTFSVEWSDTLAAGSWTSIGAGTVQSDNGTVQTVKALVPAGSGPKRFIRLVVTKP